MNVNEVFTRALLAYLRSEIDGDAAEVVSWHVRSDLRRDLFACSPQMVDSVEIRYTAFDFRLGGVESRTWRHDAPLWNLMCQLKVVE